MPWTTVGNIKGATGATGSQGATGAAGTPGSVWYTGSGAPPTATGVVGDYYLDTAAGNYYQKTAGTTWTLRGNLTGPQGTTGATGAPGPGVPTGGSTGQVLAKSSATDYATTWQTPGAATWG